MNYPPEKDNTAEDKTTNEITPAYEVNCFFYLKPTNGATMYRACLSNKDFRNYSFDLIIAVTGVSKNDAVV